MKVNLTPEQLATLAPLLAEAREQRGTILAEVRRVWWPEEPGYALDVHIIAAPIADKIRKLAQPGNGKTL